MARKKSKFSSPGQGWRGKKSKFSSPGHVSPRQNIQILAKSTNSSPKYTKMSQFPAMARKKVKNFLAGEGLARKKSKFSSPGKGWRGKIWFSDPRNSRHTPPCPAIPRKRLSREKKRRALKCTVPFSQYVSVNVEHLVEINRIRCIFSVNRPRPKFFVFSENNIFGQYVLDQTI